MIDNTQATNPIKAGINKSLADEVGTGRGNVNVVGSSAYIIARDPFRSIRRGRQLFQRKFTNLQGQGPNEQDGIGDIALDKGIGAGLSDSCASCHGRPRGSGGVGGDVATRPDSRDSASRRCWRTRSPPICARFATPPLPRHCSGTGR
jgi:hypothetical protein